MNHKQLQHVFTEMQQETHLY